MTTTITKRFTFEMGHFLHKHSGKCAFPHGHSYILEVTLQSADGKLIGEGSSEGMIMDFYDIKTVVQPIVDKYDHSFMCGPEGINFVNDAGTFAQDRVHKMEFRPTTENFAQHLFKELEKAFRDERDSRDWSEVVGPDVVLTHIRLYETATGWVDVYRD